MANPAPNPFSTPVQPAFDEGVRALSQGHTDDAIAAFTEVGTGGDHRDRVMLAEFLLAARDTSR